MVVLNPLLAHTGQPPAPHDLWQAWNIDPVLVTGFALIICVYARGRAHGSRRPIDRWRTRSFVVAMLALGVALLSPLEPLSSALASAHMVQHVLLILVAAPLLAFSAPSSTLLRGSPLSVRRASGRWRRRLRLRAAAFAPLRNPAMVWLLHVATLWVWHSASAYDATLESEAVHILEHVTFVVTGVLFWRSVIGSRSAGRVSNGVGVLLVFGMSMQSVFLSALLTFASEPWYEGYAATTAAWGLEPLADQQLAGAIMWIPAGAVYVLVGLTLLASWIRLSEREPVA